MTRKDDFNYGNYLFSMKMFIEHYNPTTFVYIGDLIDKIDTDHDNLSSYLLLSEPSTVHIYIECLLTYYLQYYDNSEMAFNDALLKMHRIYNTLYKLIETYFINNVHYRVNLVYALAAIDVFVYEFKRRHCKKFKEFVEKQMLMECLHDLRKYIPSDYKLTLSRPYGRYLLKLDVLTN